MRWIKRGQIFPPCGTLSSGNPTWTTWGKHSLLQPTPVLMGDRLRVYLGFRDDEGISRVGFVDVDATNPSNVLAVSESPALDKGEPFSFDQQGVVPCAIVQREGLFYLYYAGYRRGQKIRFTVYAGLAISADGQTFTRYSNAPIMGRVEGELLFRVIHSMIYEKGIWRVWYGAGSDFRKGEHKTLPVYDIRYTESVDGIHYPKTGRVVIPIEDDEHRVGRPYVVKNSDLYQMFYARGTEAETYRLGYADSPDGYTWTRRDDQIGINVSEEGWDSEMMAYPAVIRSANQTYLFYNGNGYGETGFGYAVLEDSP